MSKICCNFARFFESAVHSYIGITPDFGSEKRGSTPRWTTKAAAHGSLNRRRKNND